MNLHHPNLIDLTGKTFGRLKILSISHRNKDRTIFWNCLCSCGETKKVRGKDMKKGKTTSCGCWRSGKISAALKTHGQARSSMNDQPCSRTYSSWCSMRNRCLNPKTPSFKQYGGRGITICKRWNKFENFLEDMGERPENCTLDKIDNNKGYLKSNCRWVTRTEQSRNRDYAKKVNFNGEDLCITNHAINFNQNPKTIFNRIYDGWTLKEALLTPARKITQRQLV